ncbi:MAG: hypothetical protein ABI197_08310 [Granulicella sp.]
MATTPKPLSIQDLSGAVRSAVSKIKLPPNTHPYVIINPGILCGFILALEREQLGQAQEIAASVAKQVSAHIGATVAPVVQGEGVGASTEHVVKGLKPGHITMGYAPRPQDFITFGF